jgi:hypothetical protein
MKIQQLIDANQLHLIEVQQRGEQQVNDLQLQLDTQKKDLESQLANANVNLLQVFQLFTLIFSRRETFSRQMVSRRQ